MKYGSIAGGENSTVRAACQILENGGNAFDAAVGAVFTSMVSEYNLTGAGGGGAFLATTGRTVLEFRRPRSSTGADLLPFAAAAVAASISTPFSNGT